MQRNAQNERKQRNGRINKWCDPLVQLFPSFPCIRCVCISVAVASRSRAMTCESRQVACGEVAVVSSARQVGSASGAVACTVRQVDSPFRAMIWPLRTIISAFSAIASSSRRSRLAAGAVTSTSGPGRSFRPANHRDASRGRLSKEYDRLCGQCGRLTGEYGHLASRYDDLVRADDRLASSSCRLEPPARSSVRRGRSPHRTSRVISAKRRVSYPHRPVSCSLGTVDRKDEPQGSREDTEAAHALLCALDVLRRLFNSLPCHAVTSR